eukprot:jgi/Orpsp1_1/1186163/evm.model.c7180000097289.2
MLFKNLNVLVMSFIDYHLNLLDYNMNNVIFEPEEMKGSSFITPCKEKKWILFQSFNLHNTFGYNVYFNVADASEKSYAVEYIDNEMIVTEASVVTNFCMVEDKYKKSEDDLENYNIINEMKSKTSNMNVEEDKNTLAVAKNDNTQWSVIYDLLNKEAIYCFQENYDLRISINTTTNDDNSIELIKAFEGKKLITEGLSISEFNGENYLFHSMGCCHSFNGSDECIINEALNWHRFKDTNGCIFNEGTNITFQMEDKSSNTFTVPNKEGNGYYFGKNFNGNKSDILILINHPAYGYSSVSTVYTEFIKHSLENDLSEDIIRNISNTLRYYVSSSTLVRLILDYASTADDAIDLIRSLNNHNSQDVNVHYMIADASGKSYVVEYIHNELVVSESSIATNFFVAEGEYHNFGSGIDKYNTINEIITKTPNMNAEEVKNTLIATKEVETQLSIIYDLLNKEATYYFKGNYEHGYKVKLDITPENDEQNPLDDKDYEIIEVDATEEIQELDNTLLITEFKGDDGINDLVKLGGIKNNIELANYIYNFVNKKTENNNFNITSNPEGMACSTFSVKNDKGDGYFFGRNYDWNGGNGIVIVDRPNNGDYASISTTDINIINMFLEGMSREDVEKTVHETTYEAKNPAELEIIKLFALLTPIDGINEKSLCVSINAVQGDWIIDQNVEGKDDISTGTLSHLMLNKASTVDEAVEIVKKYNMHSTLGLNNHYIISDTTGKMVVVEYYENDIYITEANPVTNYYKTTNTLKQFNNEIIHQDNRSKNILKRINKKPNQNLKDVRNTLRSGIQDSTIWSIAFDQNNKEATYFYKKNFDVGYRIKLSNNDKNLEEIETETEAIYSSDEEDDDLADDESSDVTLVDEDDEIIEVN